MQRFLCLIAMACSALVNSQTIALESFATGFDAPVNVKHAGGTELYVVERKGTIKILNSDGSINPQSFLDINDRVTNAGGERGLLALAFHPDYSENGYLFVNYIDNDGNTKISRFTRLNAVQADASSELVLLSVVQPYSNHNGGDLHFGITDGYLYISLGDGGSGGDPQGYAQNLNSFLGKMLRIDVDASENGKNYSIPNDNPLVGQANVKQEIWAYGLRNPFKFSFDRSTEALWIADVGQGAIEEINRADANVGGQNYGWRCYEGSRIYNTQNCPAETTLSFPAAEYSHNGGDVSRCSITGGYVYRGSCMTDFEGSYFFADFCSDEIAVAELNGTDAYQLRFLELYPGAGWSAFAEDVNGELYAVSLNQGTIYRIQAKTLSLQNEILANIVLFPNPSRTYVDIKQDGLDPMQSVKVFNLSGQLLQSFENINSNNYVMDTRNLASGLYSIKITNKKGSIFKKLMVK